MASVISKALKITGELESTEDIRIDGEVFKSAKPAPAIGEHTAQILQEFCS